MTSKVKVKGQRIGFIYEIFGHQYDRGVEDYSERGVHCYWAAGGTVGKRTGEGPGEAHESCIIFRYFVYHFLSV